MTKQNLAPRSEECDSAPSPSIRSVSKFRARFLTVRFNAAVSSEPPLVIHPPKGVHPGDYRAALLLAAAETDFAGLQSADQNFKKEIVRIFKTQKTKSSEKTIARALIDVVRIYGQAHPLVKPQPPEIG